MNVSAYSATLSNNTHALSIFPSNSSFSASRKVFVIDVKYFVILRDGSNGTLALASRSGGSFTEGIY